MPTGACEHDGEACQMGALRTRACDAGPTVACSMTGYVCQCEAALGVAITGSSRDQTELDAATD